MTIKTKCILINQQPNGRAVVSFIQSGKQVNNPDVLINVNFADGKKAKEFEHLQEYEISFKPLK